MFSGGDQSPAPDKMNPIGGYQADQHKDTLTISVTALSDFLKGIYQHVFIMLAPPLYTWQSLAAARAHEYCIWSLIWHRPLNGGI